MRWSFWSRPNKSLDHLQAKQHREELIRQKRSKIRLEFVVCKVLVIDSKIAVDFVVDKAKKSVSFSWVDFVDQLVEVVSGERFKRVQNSIPSKMFSSQKLTSPYDGHGTVMIT